MRLKHNKKRNTAFLYESLVKEMTKAALQTDETTKKAITSILKEHFHVNSLLHRELSLYKIKGDNVKSIVVSGSGVDCGV